MRAPRSGDPLGRDPRHRGDPECTGVDDVTSNEDNIAGVPVSGLSLGGGDDPEDVRETPVQRARGQVSDTFRNPETSDLTALVTQLRQAQSALLAAEERTVIAEEKLKKAEEAGRVDALTQLENLAGIKHAFDQQLSDHMRLEERHNIAIPVSAVIVDLDFFKAINDNHGHVIGDEVLINTAALLAGSVTRKADVVARIGGDELMLLLPGTNADGAQTIAKKVQDAIIQYGSSEQGYGIGASVGTATCDSSRDSALSFETLKDMADKEMYKDKENKAARLGLSAKEAQMRSRSDIS